MTKIKYFILFVLLASITYSCKCVKHSEENKKVIFSAQAPKPIGPYSQAIFADGFLYISGQIAIDPATNIMDTTDITSQTKRVMENLRSILNASNMDFTNVIKTTIYITDMSKFAKVNEAYGQYFKDYFPARETVQVAKLPKNAGIEISMVAFKE